MTKKLSPIKAVHCAGCPLKGQPVVPGYGRTVNPDIAFVAEAPGETEVGLGVPLIGKSGQFLRTVIKDLGIDEDRCYFTNMTICHPPGNATPTAAMAKSCLGRLVMELTTVQPKLVVTLGKISSKHLAGHAIAMQRSHGIYREIELRYKGGDPFTVGVVPTWHPAAVLRGPEHFRDFVAELEYAKSIVDGEPAVIDPPYGNYAVVDTEEGFDELLEGLYSHRLVACDIETDIMDFLAGRMLCIGFSWQREHAWILDWNLCHQNWKRTTMLNNALGNVKLAFHNGIYDVPFMFNAGLSNTNYYLDTMQLHYLLDERQGTHGLERLSVKYYRAPDYKQQFRETMGLRGWIDDKEFASAIKAVSREELFLYNGADTDYTLRLAYDLSKQVKAEHQWNVIMDIEMPAAQVFTEFRMSGLLIDRDYLEKNGYEWSSEEDELVEQMKAEVGDPEFNPNSPKQLAAYMFDVLELEPFGGREWLDKPKIDESVISASILTVTDDLEAREYWTSKRTIMNEGMTGFGGDVKGLSPRSTSAYMLYWLRQQHEFPSLVLRWRHLRKRRSLYYDGLRNFMYKDGRVRPTYDLTSTRTGRKSTRNPGLHNLPRGDEIYNIFIPDPGWCYIHADYSQAEARMMAHYSGDQELIWLLNNTDIHTVMAMEIFHVTEEDWKHLSKDEIADKRIAAKMVTFGLPYGRSAAGLAPQLGVSRKEAQQYIDNYFNRLHGLRDWLNAQRDRGVKDHMITSIFGRRRRFPLITDKYHLKEVRRQAGNMAIQSAINDLTLLAYVNSIRMLREYGIPVKPGAHIHDSVNFAVPILMWKPAVSLIMKAMAMIPFSSEVDFPAECEIGERWGGMITVYKNGKWVVPDPDFERDDIPDWIRQGFKYKKKKESLGQLELGM